MLEIGGPGREATDRVANGSGMGAVDGTAAGMGIPVKRNGETELARVGLITDALGSMGDRMGMRDGAVGIANRGACARTNVSS